MNYLTHYIYFDIVINCSYKKCILPLLDLILLSFKLMAKLLLTVVERALCLYILNCCNVIASWYGSVFVIQDLS